MKLRLIYSARFVPWRYMFIGFTGAAVVCTFAVIVWFVLALLPGPHNRVHYLIAGTTPTAMGLLGALVWIERKRLQLRKAATHREPAMRSRAPEV